MQAVLILTSCPSCGTKNRMVITSRNSSPPRCGKCKEQIFERFAVVFGYVYILSNPSMPHLIKIGHTRGSLKTRVDQLSSATGVPRPFAVEAYYLSQEPRRDEKRLHSVLSSHRAPGREFFMIDLDDALRVCEATLGYRPHYIRSQHGEFREP